MTPKPLPDLRDKGALFMRCPDCIHEADRNPGHIWNLGTWCTKCETHHWPGWRPCLGCKGLGFVPVAPDEQGRAE